MLEEGTALKIDDYVVGKVLGRGSFGTVFLATVRETGESVALKLLPRDSQVDRLSTEFGVLSSISHPHIVSIRRVLLMPSKVVLEMTLGKGGDLMHLLERQPGGILPELWAKRLVKQMCRAIRYAHSTKVIHRDLKLENILLKDVEGQHALIADFGLSQLQSFNSEQRLCRSGSLYYMVSAHLRLCINSPPHFEPHSFS